MSISNFVKIVKNVRCKDNRNRTLILDIGQVYEVNYINFDYDEIFLKGIATGFSLDRFEPVWD